MAQRRKTPTTAFGAWLDAWLGAHRDWTLDALGQEIGTTNSAISQWLSGATKRPQHQLLVELARVTGEPFENLEQLVYPGRIRRAATQERTVTLTETELEALLIRAGEIAARRLWEEVQADRGG